MKLIGIVLTLLRAIPPLKAWFDQLIDAYVQQQIEAMRKENREAIVEAGEKHDQRAIEKAIGNPTPGERSSLPDSEIRRTLPGVNQP